MINWRTTLAGFIFSIVIFLSKIDGLIGQPFKQWIPHILQAIGLFLVAYFAKDKDNKEVVLDLQKFNQR